MMAMSWRVVFRPPDIASVLAMSKRYSVLPVAQIVGITVPAGTTVDLVFNVQDGYVYVPARFTIFCEPGYLAYAQHFIDDEAVPTRYPCPPEPVVDVDFYRYGFPTAVRSSAKVTVDASGSTSDVYVTYVALGALMEKSLYDRVSERLIGVVLSWLELR